MLDDKCASLYWCAPLDGGIHCEGKWLYRNIRLRNVSGFLSATGKRRMWLKYTGVGEINLELGADGVHF
jgi:hypothetical protein